MSNVNHDYDNDVQRGLYGEEAQALANKIAENVSTSRKPMIHELKILPEYFNEVQSHNKQFELCKDDRDYRVGDWILLKEFENGSYTGRECGCFGITYILRNCPEYGLADGYCIIGW